MSGSLRIIAIALGLVGLVAVQGCGKSTASTAPTGLAASAPLIGVPIQTAPAEGRVLRVIPRSASLAWEAVGTPGAVSYALEIQGETGGAWSPVDAASGLGAPSYVTPALPADGRYRWRVWAVSASGDEGEKSGWRTFSFNTDPSQYWGTWLPYYPGGFPTGAVARMTVRNTGLTLSILTVVDSPGGPVSLGESLGSFAGEPYLYTYTSEGTTFHFAMTLLDDAGTQLHVVDLDTGLSTDLHGTLD